MFNFSSSLKIYLCIEPTDMRKAFNGLYAIAKHQLDLNPMDGSLFLFANRRRDRVKLLYWDGTGFWVLAKRLESKFRPTKIGAKNWMFIGHPEAGQKSAIIYSLLQTCTIHRINPYDYLCDVLEKLIPHDGCPPEELLKTLMPENWAKTYADRLIKERPAG